MFKPYKSQELALQCYHYNTPELFRHTFLYIENKGGGHE